MPPDVKALGFDVFGTVVDWRNSIAREVEEFGRTHKVTVDAMKFAVAWRGLYQPYMDKVRHGAIGWTKLDDLHRMALDQLLKEFNITGVPEAGIDHLNRAWHRLDPWPDSVAGLTRLKKKYVLTTLSNGNVALMVNMAKRGGLPWDVILGAEPTRHYKPQREAYIGTADYLGIKPGADAGRRAQRGSESGERLRVAHGVRAATERARRRPDEGSQARRSVGRGGDRFRQPRGADGVLIAQITC